ncbi:hypothetical protein Dalk_2605 [Desulfatibacillum aliphaticivorans]|uniref:Uncharacterized protein n=1 Tax=Desulfatibacillum aliphaticivorans TaxID=218208 RepID=B8FIQ7_DESAL|nr:hypothetical protein [Desulfatibacillum aliphaticivorans]ACL04298.1 hypothetical protein Dalk_2605 [Desulfatibacillum aliphaticivorans]
MDYPVSKEDFAFVEALIESAETYNGKFDGKALALVLRLIYGYGLKKNKIGTIIVADIFDATLSPKKTIKLNEHEIPLDSTSSAKFKEFVRDAQNKGRIFNGTDLLFSRYKQTKYFDRDLKKLSKDASFNYIKHAGFFKCYLELESEYNNKYPYNGTMEWRTYIARKNDVILPEISRVFGVTKRSAYLKSTYRMPPAGRTRSQIDTSNFLKIIDELDSMCDSIKRNEKSIADLEALCKDAIKFIDTINIGKLGFLKTVNDANGNEIEVKKDRGDLIRMIVDVLMQFGMIFDPETMDVKKHDENEK